MKPLCGMACCFKQELINSLEGGAWVVLHVQDRSADDIGNRLEHHIKVRFDGDMSSAESLPVPAYA